MMIAEEQAELWGIRVSAGLLIALGCLWMLYALMAGLILAMNGMATLKGHLHSNPHWLATLNSLILMGSFAWLCFKAGAALYRARRWGAYVATAFGVLLLLFTASCVYDVFHPERQIPDFAFVLFIVPFTLLVGLWWCIYLNLPHVRARFASGSAR